MSDENLRVEIKDVSPYLPYGLKIQHITNKEIKIVNGIYEQYKDGTFIYYWNENYGTINASAYYKLVLRPLCDLKEDKYYFTYSNNAGFMMKGKNETYIRLNDLEYLFKNHYDVFGLIDKGLAVDINTLESA